MTCPRARRHGRWSAGHVLVASLDFFVSVSSMPVSMALAGPVSELIGLRARFVIPGTVPIVAALVALVWARLPAEEVAHPLTA